MLPPSHCNDHALCSALAVFGVLFLLLLLIAPEAQAQSTCAQEMAKARTQYNNGEFAAAIASVGNCLRQPSPTRAEKTLAYELLAQIQLANDDSVQAKRMIVELWKIAPAYDPRSAQEASEAFIKMALALKPAPPPLSPKRGSKKWLLLGGGGAVLTGLTFYILTRDGNNDQDEFLPPPGRPPSKN